MRAAVLAAFATLIAGCVGESPPGPLPPPGPTPATLPPEAAPAFEAPRTAALEPSAGESAGTAWVRAVWGSAERLRLLQEPLEGDAPQANVLEVCALCNAWTFDLPEGVLVPPGTAALELLATHPGAGYDLRYRSPAGEGSARLRGGEPFRLELDEGMADAPFQRASMWSFLLLLQEEPAGASQPEPAEFTIEALRADALPSFREPGDPWTAGDTVPLLEGAERAWRAAAHAQAGPLTTCPTCDGAVWAPDEGRTVPPGARSIEAVLAWDWPTPSKPTLLAGPRDARAPSAVELVQDGASERTFRFEVQAGQEDGAYQTRSFWVFAATFDEPVAVADGTMTLGAVALR